MLADRGQQGYDKISTAPRCAAPLVPACPAASGRAGRVPCAFHPQHQNCMSWKLPTLNARARDDIIFKTGWPCRHTSPTVFSTSPSNGDHHRSWRSKCRCRAQHGGPQTDAPRRRTATLKSGRRVVHRDQIGQRIQHPPGPRRFTERRRCTNLISCCVALIALDKTTSAHWLQPNPRLPEHTVS